MRALVVALALVAGGCAGSQLYDMGEALQRHRETVAGLCKHAANDPSDEHAERCAAAAKAYDHAWETYTLAYQCVEEVPHELAQAADALRGVLARRGEDVPAEPPAPPEGEEAAPPE